MYDITTDSSTTWFAADTLRPMAPPSRRLSPAARKALVSLHVVTSVGWNGVALAQVVLAITGATAGDPSLRHHAFVLMRVFDLALNVPLGFAALLTGLLLSWLQPWGVFLHWWVTLKFTLTLAVLTFAGVQMRVWVERAGEASRVGSDGVPTTAILVTGIAFNALLVTATVLSVAKPGGRTPRGRRLLAARG